jgi:transcriptional regulator with XRE-family HTH domain
MIRLHRAVNNISLRVLAKEIGTSAATLMRIEQGYAFDTATLLRLLAWFQEQP